MTTRLVIPIDGQKISEVRIWHALPNQKSWSGSTSGTGGKNISFAPDDGAHEEQKKYESHYIVWRQKRDFAPGTRLSFTTRYTVRSAARQFDSTGIKLQWPTDFIPPMDINPEIAEIADKIRKTYSPTQAVLQFCVWLKRNLTYDASVPYLAGNVNSTMAFRRGHCGHFYNVFAQMCRRVGLPVRDVRGLCLQTPNGHGQLASIRADWTNVHSWAEICLPKIGWVEVEPSYGMNAFTIPACFVQNNKWFQNYVTQIWADGKLHGASWTPENDAFVSPYGVENIITFTSVPNSTKSN